MNSPVLVIANHGLIDFMKKIHFIIISIFIFILLLIGFIQFQEWNKEFQILLGKSLAKESLEEFAYKHELEAAKKALQSASLTKKVGIKNYETINALQRVLYEGLKINHLEFKNGHFLNMKLSPNQKYLGIVSDYNKIHILNLETGIFEKTFDGVVFAFSIDSKSIAVFRMGELAFYNLITGELQKTIPGLKKTIYELEYTNDGKYLIAGTWEGSIKIFEAFEYKETTDFPAFKSFITGIGIYKNKDVIVASSHSGELAFFELSTGKKIKELIPYAPKLSVITDLKLMEESNKIYTNHRDEKIRIWDAKTGNLIQILAKHEKNVESFAISPDGSLASFLNKDNTMTLWDLNSEKTLATYPCHKKIRKAVQFAKNGEFLYFAGWNGNIEVLNIHAIKNFHILNAHSNSINRIDISPNGEFLLSGGSDKFLKVWDWKNRNETHKVQNRNFVLDVLFLEDGSQFAAIDKNGIMLIWDMESKKLITEALEYQISSDSLHLSNNKTLVTPYSNHFLSFHKPMEQFEIQTETGHSGKIQSIRFSPDESIVASGSLDGTVKIWDANHYNELFQFQGLGFGINSLRFTPDGNYLLAGDAGGNILIWSLDLEKLMNGVCERIKPYLKTHQSEKEIIKICKY